MPKHDDGGPAYPIATSDGYVLKGMSLWDAAALAALQGIHAHGLDHVVPTNANWTVRIPDNEYVARRCFDAADAFIAEWRERMEKNNED